MLIDELQSSGFWSDSRIAFLVCGIIFALGLVGAIIGYVYRHKHPFNPQEAQNSNFFGRWIKSNFNLFMWIIITMIILATGAFFVAFALS